MTTSTERIDPARTALIAYDVCKRILTPQDPAARERMRPALEAWRTLIEGCRALDIPIIYTTPVSRADGADVVLLPTDLSAETGVPSLTNCVEGTPEAGFPDEIAPRPEDYVFLKRRPSAFYGTGVAELLRTLKRSALVIGDVHQLEPVIDLSREDEQRMLHSLRLSTGPDVLGPYRAHDEASSSAQHLADRAPARCHDRRLPRGAGVRGAPPVRPRCP